MNKLGERDQEAEFTCVQFPGLKQGMNALSPSLGEGKHGRSQIVLWPLSLVSAAV